jgi:hypothetical protein
VAKRLAFFVVATNTALCTALALLYPLGPGLYYPRKTWAQLAGAWGNDWAWLAHVGIYLALFTNYFIVLRHVTGLFRSASPSCTHPPALSRLLILVGWLLPCLALLGAFPGESADVFDYLFRGRMLVEYGASPLNRVPLEFNNYPFHRYVSWTEWVDAYGPLWEYSSALISLSVHGLFSTTDRTVLINQSCQNVPALCVLLMKYVTAYRLLAITLTGICGALIYTIVHQKMDGAHARFALLAWLWNPLVLISAAVGAHNDVLMLVFVLLGILALQRGRWLWGLLAIVLAAHVKLTALILIPPFLLWVAWRCGWREALQHGLACAAIALPASWLLYAPLGGWETLPRNIYERGLLSSNSIGELAQWVLRNNFGMARFEAQRWVSRASTLVFVLIAGIVLLRCSFELARKKSARAVAHKAFNLTHICLIIVLIYLCIGSFWFQAWYGVWPIALATLWPNRAKALWVVGGFGCGVLLGAACADYLGAPPPVLASAFTSAWPRWQVASLVVALWSIPLVVGLMWRSKQSATEPPPPPT